MKNNYKKVCNIKTSVVYLSCATKHETLKTEIMTKQAIKLETIKANREQIVNAITEAIKGTDLKLKDAMTIFLGARSTPDSLTSVMSNGLQAVRKAAQKVGNKSNKLENRQYFITTPNQLPSSMR